MLHAELAALRMTLRSRFGSSTLVARSPAMRRVLTQVEIARNHMAPVLFSGPSGSGKEHLARVVHFAGPARGSWFVPLDCRRLAADELERVLTRLIESARPATGGLAGGSPQPGSVFLADVECLPRDLQERLVLIYSNADKPPAVRLLAATCLALSTFVADPRLRTDFQAFISPMPIEVPSLSQRPDDLPLLAQHFLEEHNRDEQKQVGGFADDVWPLLARYEWPGNLDELVAVVFEARQHAVEALIRPHDLPFRFRTALAAQELPAPPDPPPMLLDPLLTKVETRLITLALSRSRNNKSKAAELLGINRARLLRRIEQLQIGQTNAETITDEAAEDPESDEQHDDLPDDAALP
jgi:DNA-binding NtrC family response regulator